MKMQLSDINTTRGQGRATESYGYNPHSITFIDAFRFTENPSSMGSQQRLLLAVTCVSIHMSDKRSIYNGFNSYQYKYEFPSIENDAFLSLDLTGHMPHVSKNGRCRRHSFTACSIFALFTSTHRTHTARKCRKSQTF